VPVDLRVGDQVLFGKYSGTEVKIDDEEYLIMREGDIFGVVEAAAKARPASAQKK
jgi:chaperonin GroES